MKRTAAAWPLSVVLVLLATAIAFVAVDFARRTDAGGIIYCLDDAYIHMAIAKNLAAHGTFGVAPDAFAFSSSSPLWLAVLWICFEIFGPAETLPLVLNVAAAVALIVIAARILRGFGASALLQLGMLAALVFHVPLIPNVFSGMEHTLHIGISLAFLWTAAAALARNDARSNRYLLVLAPLLASVRYEGLFLVGVVCVLLALRRRWQRALVLGVLAAAPPTCLGLWSLSQGGPFLPSPLLLKGASPESAGLSGLVAFVWRGYEQLAENRWIGRLVVVCIGLWILRFRAGRRWDATQIWLVAFLAAAFLHAQFAAWGWFYRYEAYLVAMGVIAIGGALGGWRDAWGASRRQRVLAGVALAGTLVYLGDGTLGRWYDAIHRTPKAMRNIFEQQYQMGLFLRAHAPRERLFANDIGAIHFLAEPRVVDLVGLANHDIVLARRRGDVDARIAALVSRRELGDVAVIYAHRFGRYFQDPPWIEVGRWTIADNVVCDHPTVVWLARDAAAAAALRLELAQFGPALPRGVAWGLRPE